MTTRNLADLDAQIAAAERELDAAQNRWRNRPRGAPRMGGGNAPIQIDPAARADMLDRGLAVDQAVIDLEQLKLRRAEARIAELNDPATLASLEAARDEAQQAMIVAEAVATEVRIAFARANGALKDRQERAKTWREEIARAQAAIHSAESVQAKERAQRDELHVA